MSASHQLIAANPDLSVFVTANAGSGKTTTLVNRVARLLLKGARPEAILCVTYTKAAAAEMQTRLFKQLGEWAVLDDEGLIRELVRLDDRSDLPSREELSRARRLFARALETPGGLKIQTIHAFCEKLLRRFPIEAGVSPRFKMLEDQAAVALSHAAREELAVQAFRDPDGPLGRAYSHFAVELDWGRFLELLALIEAKRDDLADYVARVEAGDAPGPHALTGADPDGSPEEVEAEFMRALDPGHWRDLAEAMATGSTNDQKCAERMRAAGDAWTFAGLRDVFLTQTGPRASMGTKQAPAYVVAWLADLQLSYLAALDRWRAAKAADDTVKVLTLARAHAAFYEAAKAATGALDFGDLVSRSAALLSKPGLSAWVLYKLDGGIDHVLVDEAQDTAPEQWAILQALTSDFFSSATGRSIFAVGDEKQSIYSFQGARPEQLRRQARAYETRVGQAFRHVPLETSYRSTPEVLRFVDKAFDDPARRISIAGVEGDIHPHHPAREGQPGSVELVPLFIDEPQPDRDAWTAPVDQETRQSARKRLAKHLADDIRRQVETGVAVYEKGALRPCGYGDFLVLVRRRDALFEEVIRALKLTGVPVAGADRLKLKAHIAFDDLLSLARFALFPDDELSLAEVLRSPLCDVDEDSLFELAGAEKRPPLWKILRDRASERPEWTRAHALLDAAIAARGRDPFAFFSEVLNRVDDTGQSGRARFLRRLGREAMEAIDETLNQVLAAEGRGGTDLETCLALLESADVEVKRELEGPRGEVRVMTVHGAKGLEAPVVILPDTTMKAKGQGPTLLPLENEDWEGPAWLMCPGSGKEDCPVTADARKAREDRTADESLRLLYVALTRARDRLIVLGRTNKSGEAEKGSWWSVIEETFDRLDGVESLEDGGRRFGPAPVTIPRAPTASAEEAATLPDWVRQAAAPDPGARYASPSRMDETLRIPAPSPLERSGSLGRFRRGDLIHRLLERLPDVAPEARPDAALRLLARERDLSDEQREEMIAAAFGVLDDPRFAPVFGPGSRAEVALTGRSDDLPPGVSISGRIDRLVVTPERVLIVDYKTNRPAPPSAEAVDPAYVLQLAVYAAVLRRLYPDRPVEAALV
uniref:double-strand break repair helicase AddA n=1 Tax=Brevundimonas sp. TaxID=1871086 RepID=UPI0025F94C39